MNIYGWGSGPYPLTMIGINGLRRWNEVPTPGVYTLGDRVGLLGASPTIHQPLYVGRSDEDVLKRLKDHINDSCWQDGTNVGRREFMFAYCADAKQAYGWECWLFHTYRWNLCNKIHPRHPDFWELSCPVCRELHPPSALLPRSALRRMSLGYPQPPPVGRSVVGGALARMQPRNPSHGTTIGGGSR